MIEHTYRFQRRRQSSGVPLRPFKVRVLVVFAILLGFVVVPDRRLSAQIQDGPRARVLPSSPKIHPKSEGGILAIFAHPDDETWVGPLLVHYARRGIAVNLVILTSGQKVGVPTGREAEALTACRAYGIPEPYFLREQDGGIASMRRAAEIVTRLSEIVRELKPAVVITWGPEGFTGHSDHRAVSNLVTEVFQSMGTTNEAPRKLYYYAYPADKISAAVPAYFPTLGVVDPSLISTIVQAKDGLAATSVAQGAYVSQFKPEEIDGRNMIREKTFNGNVYLRLAISRLRKSMKKEKDVFEGIR